MILRISYFQNIQWGKRKCSENSTLAEQVCTVKTSDRYQLNFKKFFTKLHFQFNSHTLPVTPFNPVHHHHFLHIPPFKCSVQFNLFQICSLVLVKHSFLQFFPLFPWLWQICLIPQFELHLIFNLNVST